MIDIVKNIYITSLGDASSVKLSELSSIPFNNYQASVNDIVMSPEILIDTFNLLAGNKAAIKNDIWQPFLNLCTFIEAWILAKNIIVRVPFDKNEFVLNIVTGGLLLKILRMSQNDFDDIIKVSLGYNSDNLLIGQTGEKNFLFMEQIALPYQEKVLDYLKSVDNITDDDSNMFMDFANHYLYGNISLDMGCSYAAGYCDAGVLYNTDISNKISLIQKLTPYYLYEIVKESHRKEFNELQILGTKCDLFVPPMAMIVLEKCKDDISQIGSVLLEERYRVRNLRKEIFDIRTNLNEASSLKEAVKLKKKIELMNKSLTGVNSSESFKATTWNGLLASIPLNIWDGITREDIDIKSLVSFFAGKPLKEISSLIRKRNYIYLLDIKNKAMKIKDYSSIVEKTLGVTFSVKDKENLMKLQI